MADRYEAGVLDTCAYIDLGLLDPAALPKIPELTAVTMAELYQGVAMAKDAAIRAARTEKLGAAIVDFAPLPFDGDAAARYGTLVAGSRDEPGSATSANGSDDRRHRVLATAAALHPERR